MDMMNNRYMIIVMGGGLSNRIQFDEESHVKDYLYSVKDITLFDYILQYIIDTIGREFSVFNDYYLKYVISLDKIDYSQNGIQYLNLIDFFK